MHGGITYQVYAHNYLDVDVDLATEFDALAECAGAVVLPLKARTYADGAWRFDIELQRDGTVAAWLTSLGNLWHGQFEDATMWVDVTNGDQTLYHVNLGDTPKEGNSG